MEGGEREGRMVEEGAKGGKRIGIIVGQGKGRGRGEGGGDMCEGRIETGVLARRGWTRKMGAAGTGPSTCWSKAFLPRSSVATSIDWSCLCLLSLESERNTGSMPCGE